MNPKLESAAMPRQSQIARLIPEDTPLDPAAALDAETNRVFVVVADALPNGRKQLGHHAVRVAKAAAGQTVARPSDWLHLAAKGGDLATIVTHLESVLAAIKQAAPAVQRPTPATLLRETTEANIAVIEYHTNRTPEARRVAERELAQAELVIERERAALHADRFNDTQARLSALSYLRGAVAPRGD